jgi:hypothetical protein
MKNADALLKTLSARFDAHPERHKGVSWESVAARLKSQSKKLAVIAEMEATGGEPDVIAFDKKTGAVTFCDCAEESPKGRRSLCFDRKALDARKENKPSGNVEETAVAIGISLLTEEQYRMLQTLGEFDRKTSSWVATPADVRAKGGALFCDRRYGKVWLYHNGAESYYAARGFRGLVVV